MVPHSSGAGRACPGLAVSAARKWGVDLSAHQSQLLTPELVSHADAVFVFDMANYQWIWSNYPRARARLHFLGFVGSDEAPIIDDPFGAGPEAFEVAYNRIARALLPPASLMKGAPS